MLNDLLNQVILFEYMFGPLIRPCFVCLSNGSIVVVVEFNWLGNARNHSKFYDEFLDPNSFFNYFRENNVLELYSRINNYTLLGVFPAKCTTIQTKHRS